MRLIILTETLCVGGAETFVVRLASALARSGHEVCLAIMHGELIDPALAARLHERVQLRSCDLPAVRSLHRLDRVLRAARIDWSMIRRAQASWFHALVSEWQPDLVHSHQLKADALALEVRTRGKDYCHVLTMHGDYGPFSAGLADPQRLGIHNVIDQVLAGADAIVAICREHAEWVEEASPSAMTKVRIIRNGYAAEPNLRIPRLIEGYFRFGMVSRGVRLKGWEVAIEAFGMLAKSDAELVLVGEGPFIEELRCRSLPPNVRLAGHSSTPLEWIEQFDVCLLPSMFPYESLPTVVIEYLYAGKPVIATDVGEIRDMLLAPDGSLAGRLLDFDGMTVSTGQLAGFMREMVDNPALRIELGRTALEAFAKFDMAACLNAYEQLYAGLMAEGTERAA